MTVSLLTLQVMIVAPSPPPPSCPQERLGFDNELAALEKAIKVRQKDLRDLQSMYVDAQLSRDMAKVGVATVYHHHTMRGTSPLV